MRKAIPGMLSIALCALTFDASARFVSTDPVKADQKTGANFNRYHYANNNPYRYTDPDGREIRAANPADYRKIENMINSLAVGVYRFDKGGSLTQAQSAGDSSRFSSYYSERLNQAIASDKTINIQAGNTYTNPFTNKTMNVEGGLTQSLGNGPSDQNVVVSGQSYTGGIQTSTGDPLTETPNYILAHELVGHAIPGIGLGDTGNAVNNENKIRIEIPDADLRKVEPAHVE